MPIPVQAQASPATTAISNLKAAATAAVAAAPQITPASIITNELITPSLPVPTTQDEVIEALVGRIAGFLLINPENERDEFVAKGRAVLRSATAYHVERNIQIEMVLPAFPFKSPSAKKVLGVLPDLAEELVLRRLEALCKSIQDVYAPGARVNLVSDGLVYGDLLGVADDTIFQYDDELKTMAKDFGLTHLRVVPVQTLLKGPEGALDESNDYMTEEEYVSNAPTTRHAFLSLDIGHYDSDMHIKADLGALNTYRGYLKFLKSDLEGSPLLGGEPLERTNSSDSLSSASSMTSTMSKKGRERVISTIAKKMMANGARFSALVEAAYPTSVRLSIHAHTNGGPKFAFRPFPGFDMIHTPWHNVVVEKADGSLVVQHHEEVDRSTHELVHRRGRPYFFREIDPNMQWDGPAAGTTFERTFPFGMLVRAPEGKKVSWNDVPMDKVRALTQSYPLMVFRGFETVNREDFVTRADEMGPILEWSGFGKILEIKEDLTKDMNSSLTREAMPMHYDGVFKIEQNADGKWIPTPPQYQMFQCLAAPELSDPNADAGGRTLFANTNMILEQAIRGSDLEEIIKTKEWSVFTPLNHFFGGEKLYIPFLQENPSNGHEVIQWHEHWEKRLTAFKAALVEVEGVSPERSVEVSNALTGLLYDRRFTTEHTWVTGDFVIADNIEMMHTRTAFGPCNRELWRIHIN